RDGGGVAEVEDAERATKGAVFQALQGRAEARAADRARGERVPEETGQPGDTLVKGPLHRISLSRGKRQGNRDQMPAPSEKLGKVGSSARWGRTAFGDCLGSSEEA